MMDSFNMHELMVFWGPEKELESPVGTSILHSLTANLVIADHCLTRLLTLWAPFLPPCPPSTMDCTLKSSNPPFLPEVGFLRFSVRSDSNNKTKHELLLIGCQMEVLRFIFKFDFSGFVGS